MYLYRLGMAPQIHDLYGKVKFTGNDQSFLNGLTRVYSDVTVMSHCLLTEEEINNMQRALDQYGIQMPAFNKIGGLLANELSVDEAAGKKKELIGCEALCPLHPLTPPLSNSPCSCNCH